MADRSSELRSDVAVLRRRWPIILVAAVLGLGLGILYASLVPLQLTSRSKVLLSSGSSSGGDSSEAAIDTQIQILLSTPVLDKAGQALHPALSATQVMDRIDVEAATSQLITIDAFSPRPHEAQTLSQAIADAYVQTITDNMRAVSGAIVGDLRTRRDELNQQLKALLTQVHATKVRLDAEAPKSPVGVRDAQILAQLTASQGDIAKQLESVKGELQGSGAVGTASTLASVVQPAAPATGPGRVPGLVTWGAVGALLGGALAAALIALRARRDPRLRARDDMADAVGSSVLADVRSRRQRSVAEWLALFETYVASPVDAWAFRQLLRALATMTDAAPLTRSGGRAGRLEHPRSIAVVTVAGDVRGLAIGPQLAAFAASLGITTRFVLASSHDAAASMWAACSAERAAEPRPGLRLEVRPDTPIPLEGLPGAAGGSFDELLTGGSAHVNGSLAEPEQLVSTLEGLVSAIDAALVSSARLDDDDEDDADAADEDRDDHEHHDEHRDEHVDEHHDDHRDEDAGDPADRDDAGEHADDEDEEEEAVEATPVVTSPAAQPSVAAPTEVLPLLHAVPRHPAADLTIVLVVVDPFEPSLDAVPSTEVTVLSLAPGVSSREQLARLAVAVDDVGRRIDGLVVADPDPADRTTGRRTLDERARQAPLPLRVTGISQSPMAASERGTNR